MFRRFFSTALVVFVLGGFAVAETYRGTLVKLEDGKVTVRVRSKEDIKGTEKTFKVSKDAKFVVKSKDAEDKEIKAEDVKELIAKAAKAGKGKGDGEKGKGKGKGRGGARGGFGTFATVETTGEGDAETVTSITIGGGFGKGKRNKDKN